MSELQHRFFPAYGLTPIQALAHLISAGLVHDYFLYSQAAETIVTINPLARVSITADAIVSDHFMTGRHFSEPATDPLRQLRQHLSELPIRKWRAIGYITFDFSSFYYPTKPRTTGPLLELIIPSIELRFHNRGIEISGFGDLAKIEQHLTHHNGEPHSPSVPLGDVSTDGQESDYCARVRRLKTLISQRRLSKAIVSRSVVIPGDLDVIRTYAAATGNEAVRSYCFQLGETRGVGFSPEMFLTADAAGLVTMSVLAGTRPRGVEESSDENLAQELFDSAKEMKEHALSVVLAQSEMSSVCMPDTVRIYDFMQIKKYRCVQHLSTNISGRLKPDWTVFDALRKLFPAITVSGVPKAAALREIGLIENVPRGIYAGAIGWFDDEGRADLALAIRSAFQYGPSIYLNAGAGIIAESQEQLEYVESCNKMKTMSGYLMVSRKGFANANR